MSLVTVHGEIARLAAAAFLETPSRFQISRIQTKIDIQLLSRETKRYSGSKTNSNIHMVAVNGSVFHYIDRLKTKGSGFLLIWIFIKREIAKTARRHTYLQLKYKLIIFYTVN